jgi:hypothetical protein
MLTFDIATQDRNQLLVAPRCQRYQEQLQTCYPGSLARAAAGCNQAETCSFFAYTTFGQPLIRNRAPLQSDCLQTLYKTFVLQLEVAE